MGIVMRQSFKGTAVSYLGTAIGFITSFFILTKYLTPEEIGLTRVIYEVALLIANIALVGIPYTAIKFYPYFEDRKNNDNGFFFYLILLPTIGFIVSVILYLLFKTQIIAFFTNENSILFSEYYYWVIPLMLIIVYWIAMEAYSSLKMRIAVPKFIREVLVRILLLIVYILFAWNLFNLDGLVFWYIFSYFVALISIVFYVSKIGSVSFKHDYKYIDESLKKNIGNYILFTIIATLGGGVLLQLDLFMVSSKIGLDAAGIYSIAFLITSFIEMPSRSISTIASPLVSTSMKNGNIQEVNDLYKKVSIHQFIAGSFIFLLIWCNIRNIFAIMPNGDIYEAGIWVVFFIAISRLISMTFNLSNSIIIFSKYYYWVLGFSLIITAIGITANLLLIPIWGITGAAIATLIAALISTIFQLFVVFNKVKCNPLSWGLLKYIGILFFMFALNQILPEWSNYHIVDAIYRTLVLSTIMVYVVYKMRISEDICFIINKIIKRSR